MAPSSPVPYNDQSCALCSNSERFMINVLWLCPKWHGVPCVGLVFFFKQHREFWIFSFSFWFMFRTISCCGALWDSVRNKLSHTYNNTAFVICFISFCVSCVRWVNRVRMFELGSRLAHMYLSSGPGEPSGCVQNSSLSSTAGLDLAKNKEEKIPGLQEFLQHVRSVHL